MIKYFSILFVALVFLGMTATAQAVPPKPPPLQPVGEQGLTDFTSEVNDPDSPGNLDRNDDNETVFQEPAGEPDDINGESSTSVISDSSADATGISIIVTTLIVALVISGLLVGLYYWYKTRKTK
jgi:hypothetical protein